MGKQTTWQKKYFHFFAIIGLVALTACGSDTTTSNDNSTDNNTGTQTSTLTSTQEEGATDAITSLISSLTNVSSVFDDTEGNALVKGVVQTQTLDCANFGGSGSMTVSLDNETNESTVTFDECTYPNTSGEDVFIDGSIEADADDSGNDTVITITYDDLTFSVGGETFTADGTINSTVSDSGDTQSMETTNLTVSFGGFTLTMTADMTISTTTNGSGDITAQTLAGTLSITVSGSGSATASCNFGTSTDIFNDACENVRTACGMSTTGC